MPDAGSRVAAAFAAAARGPLAAEYLHDPIPGVRRQAARAWEGAPDPSALPTLRGALAGEPTDTVRLALARAALACGATRSEARAHLAVVWVGGPAGPVDPGVAVGLTPGARIRALDAKSTGTDLSERALHVGDPAALAAPRGPGFAYLVAAIGVPDAWPDLVRGLDPSATWALGEIGAVDAAPVLIDALGDDTLAPLAAAALHKLGPAVGPLLEAALHTPQAAWAAGVLARLSPDTSGRFSADSRPDVCRAATLADPDEALGWGHLRARRWYEAHETFESAWRRASGDRRRFLQALVHAAVSLEHLRRGFPDRAAGQWRRCWEKRAPAWANARPELLVWLDAVDALHTQAACDPATWPVPSAD